ncbi:MAG: diaminobutyrate--2-oxoglutarate transaminase, partial [bacterium]|nr:diaminobutyrate--2-oxoglutarate transaminase [bacterium]
DDPARAGAVTAWALRHGVLILPSGQRGEVVSITPPLTIGFDDLDTALEILRAAIREHAS